MLKAAVNLFWFAFCADGVLSLIDEILSLENRISPLSLVRGLLALGVIIASIVMAGAVALTPRAPKRVLVPMIAFAWWNGAAFAFPLGSMEIPHLAIWMALGQCALGVAVYLLFRSRDGLGRLPFAVASGPWISPRHAMVAAPAVLAVMVGFAAVSVLSGLATEIESLTGGYVKLRADGLYVVERHFQSNGREVRLAGMVHVALGEFYSGVLPEADPAIPAVVLVEGVTDRRRLLGSGPLSYARVAKLLKVTPQEESTFTERVVSGLKESPPAPAEAEEPAVRAPAEAIHFRHADVDVETFDPKTIAFIVTVMSLFQSDSFHQAFAQLTDPGSPLSDSAAQTQVMEDILYARNERLVAEIEDSLKQYRRVIVPWGALHLPEIESWLRSHDFVQSGEIERKAVGFW